MLNVSSHKLTVKNSKISGTHYYALWVENKGEITVESGTFTAIPSSYGHSVLNNAAAIIIKGGEFGSADSNVPMFTRNSESALYSVSGGKFVCATLCNKNMAVSNLEITGGVFSVDPSSVEVSDSTTRNYVAEGYTVTKDSTANTWTVSSSK